MLATLAAAGIKSCYRTQGHADAFRYSRECLVPRQVMMLDGGFYAVVSPKEAAKLRKMGFENAPTIW